MNTAPLIDRRVLLNLVWMLVATDVALIVLHLATGWSLVNLDREANISAWYSSTKLMGVALLSTVIGASLSNDGLGRRMWLLNAVAFVGLSADEVASLHETLARRLLELPALDHLRATLTGGDDVKSSFAWVWVFLPLIVAALAFFLVLAMRTFKGTVGVKILFFVGIACLVSAVALEAAIIAFPPVSEWGTNEADRYRRITTIEESAELVGITLLFGALALWLAIGGANRKAPEPGRIGA